MNRAERSVEFEEFKEDDVVSFPFSPDSEGNSRHTAHDLILRDYGDLRVTVNTGYTHPAPLEDHRKEAMAELRRIKKLYIYYTYGLSVGENKYPEITINEHYTREVTLPEEGYPSGFDAASAAKEEIINKISLSKYRHTEVTSIRINNTK